MAIRSYKLSDWSDPDRVEEAMNWSEHLSWLFSARDYGEGKRALGYNTSPELAAAHDLFCKLYDRLDEIAPDRTAFSGSP